MGIYINIKLLKNNYWLYVLGIISFLESSIFFLPADPFMIGPIVSKKYNWKFIAFFTTITSVLGGILGYALGLFAWQIVGKWIISDILKIKMEIINSRLDIALPYYISNIIGKNYLFESYDYFGLWIVFLFGFTFLPYKLITITGGFARIDFLSFILISFLSRGLRFYIVCFFINKFGDPTLKLISKNLKIIFILIFIFASISGIVNLAFLNKYRF